MADIRVLEQDYHRNGIGGAGFVVSVVDWPDSDTGGTGTHFVCMSFWGEGATPKERRASFVENTGALLLTKLMAADIAFGSNSWRGSDYLGPAIADAWQARCREQGYDPFDDDWKPCTVRPQRTTEDIEAVEVRARIRLSRRIRLTTDESKTDPTDWPTLGRKAGLVREAAALVAAIQGMLDENQSRWEYGDR